MFDLDRETIDPINIVYNRKREREREWQHWTEALGSQRVERNSSVKLAVFTGARNGGSVTIYCILAYELILYVLTLQGEYRSWNELICLRTF